MVLDAEVLEPRALERVAGREVVGVQVVRDHLGRDGEEARKCATPSLKAWSVS